jgi:aarF domain-containing kinase
MRLARGSARVLAVSTGLCAAAAAYKHETDEGARRTFLAYAAFLPVVAHYRAVEFRHKLQQPPAGAASDEWRALDRRYAAPTVAVLGKLGGMYAKYGQTAAGLTNTLSDGWVQELRKLEDQVPPRPAAVVRQTILEETGREPEQIFSSFDQTPLGSASIGQVHRATLLDGREVAVKVQYPDSERLFRSDMKAIRGFFQLVAPENLFQLDALEKQNALELDYTIEAANLSLIHGNMSRHGFLPREVAVPLPVAGLSTRRMLVMQLLPGPKLVDGLRRYGAIAAAREGKTLEQLEAEMRARFEDGFVPAKYEGPSAGTIAAYLRLMRARDFLLNVAVGLYNVSLGWAGGRATYVESCLPPNAPRVIDTLMRVHGTQLLADGVFNADPHGGNFLMLPDDRIGLIDFGATKHLTEKERIGACVMFAALHRRDEQMMIDMAQVSGYKSKYGKKEVLMKLMQFGYDSWGKDVTGGKNLVQFIDDLKAIDPWEEVPDNFVMCQFMTIRLRALALAMNHPITVSDYWGPIALEVLRREGLPYEKWDKDMLIKYKPEMNMQKYKFA